jgi:methyltransferase (TIGR00027 family)
MRPLEASRTAEWVAAGRALASLRRTPRACDDRFALGLLPLPLREAVETRAARRWPTRPSALARSMLVEATAAMMGPRTAAIDAHLEAASPLAQLVVLGAGLDARAHRMPSLSRATVFEVDHPASQASKRARIAGLPMLAERVVYVPVDFEDPRASLAGSLLAAGHSVEQPTTWVWEGVITYLALSDIRRTLDVVRERSSAGSRLIATYNEPSLARRVVSALSSRTGEPHRAWFHPHVMRRLLEAFGFSVLDDTTGVERTARFGLEATALDHLWTRGHHVVAARRLP